MSYCSKLKELWEEQSAIFAIPTCTCETLKAYAEVVQQQKLQQFLMGLNDSYSQARSQILLMLPLPSVNDAYGMILQDETQRALANGDRNASTEGIAMIAKGRGRSRGRSRGDNRIGCTHCLKKGHSRENCYELVGYPPNFKGPKVNQREP